MDGLRRLVRVLRAGNAEAFRDSGITSAQLFVLRHIANNPGCSLDEVVRRTLTTQSAASEVVARLIAQGFVTSAPAQHDRRRVALTVTLHGSRVGRESLPPIQDMLVAAVQRLPTAQQERIANGLADWLAAAKLEGIAPSMFFEPNESTSDCVNNKKKMEIQADWTVNETLRRVPASMRVLNAFAIDMCCGGEETLATAAGAANVQIESLVTAISEVVDESA